MCTVLLPPGGYPIEVNKYIISQHTNRDYGCLNSCIIEYYHGYIRYLSYHFLTHIGSSVTVMLEVCYSVLVNVNSSFGIVIGVTGFI
jgi:hypothetical protein